MKARLHIFVSKYIYVMQKTCYGQFVNLQLSVKELLSCRMETEIQQKKNRFQNISISDIYE